MVYSEVVHAEPGQLVCGCVTVAAGQWSVQDQRSICLAPAAVSQAALVLVLHNKSLCVHVCYPLGPALRCSVEPTQVRCAGHGQGSQDGRRHLHRGNEVVRVGAQQEAEEILLSIRQ